MSAGATREQLQLALKLAQLNDWFYYPESKPDWAGSKSLEEVFGEMGLPFDEHKLNAATEDALAEAKLDLNEFMSYSDVSKAIVAVLAKP